jgi:hypothetical protein
MTSTRLHQDAWTAFGAGVLGGVVGGLSMLSFAGIFAVALIAILGGAALRPRPFGAAGVLLGWAAAWTLLFAGAQARCDPASCVGPSLAPWSLAIALLAMTGLVLLVAGATRATWLDAAAGAWRPLGSRRPFRVAPAVVLGLLAGAFASIPLIVGWFNAMAIGLWFAWRHRPPGRRIEIVWFALAAGVAFTVRAAS